MKKTKIILLVFSLIALIGIIIGIIFLIPHISESTKNNKESTNVLAQENLGKEDGLGINENFNLLTAFKTDNESLFTKTQQSIDNKTFDVFFYNGELKLFGYTDNEMLRVQLCENSEDVANIKYKVLIPKKEFKSTEECVRKISSTLTQNKLIDYTYNIAKSENQEYIPLKTLEDIENAEYVEATFSPPKGVVSDYSMVAFTTENTNDSYIITITTMFNSSTPILP